MTQPATSPPTPRSIVVYADRARANLLQAILPAACGAAGVGVQLSTGSAGAIYRRLAQEANHPLADLVVSQGAGVAQSLFQEHLTDAYQPATWQAAQPPVVSPHPLLYAPDWGWTSLELLPFRLAGPTSGSPSLADLNGDGVTSLAMPDPARSRDGLLAVLASLDAARQTQGAPDTAWAFWQQRIQRGARLEPDDTSALTLLASGQASHALLLRPGPEPPLAGLAPVPTTAALVHRPDPTPGARNLLDWLCGPDAAAAIAAAGGLSPWQAASNGLAALLQATPPPDVGWQLQQERSVRQEWLSRGLSPHLPPPA